MTPEEYDRGYLTDEARGGVEALHEKLAQALADHALVARRVCFRITFLCGCYLGRGIGRTPATMVTANCTLGHESDRPPQWHGSEPKP